MNQIIQQRSVKNLIQTFQKSLSVLVLIANSVGIKWNGDLVYDDWERIETVFFTSIVCSPIRDQFEKYGYSETAPYDGVINRRNLSFLFSPSLGTNLPFVRLETLDTSFDTIVFVERDKATLSLTDKLFANLYPL